MIRSFFGRVRYVRLGATNYETANPAQIQEIVVKSAIIPNNFEPMMHYNDIMLLELNRNVTINNYVRPICFEKVDDLNGKELMTTTWGKESFASVDSPNDLKKVRFSFTPYETCKEEYVGYDEVKLPKGIVNDQQTCATLLTGEIDTCGVRILLELYYKQF